MTTVTLFVFTSIIFVIRLTTGGAELVPIYPFSNLRDCEDHFIRSDIFSDPWNSSSLEACLLNYRHVLAEMPPHIAIDEIGIIVPQCLVAEEVRTFITYNYNLDDRKNVWLVICSCTLTIHMRNGTVFQNVKPTSLSLAKVRGEMEAYFLIKPILRGFSVRDFVEFVQN